MITVTSCRYRIESLILLPHAKIYIHTHAHTKLTAILLNRRELRTAPTVKGLVVALFTLSDRSNRVVVQATPICGIQITQIRSRPLRIVTLFNSRVPCHPRHSLEPRNLKAACSRAPHASMTPSFLIDPHTHRQRIYRCIQHNGGFLANSSFEDASFLADMI